MEKQIFKFGNIKLILDPDEFFPDDPGLGTPILVVQGDYKNTATYECAINEGILDNYKLTHEEYDWLENQLDRVERFYFRLDVFTQSTKTK